MEKKKSILGDMTWMQKGISIGAALGAGLLTVNCLQYCTGLHEVLGVATLGGLLGVIPGAALGAVTELVVGTSGKER